MNHPAPTVQQQQAIDAILDFVRGNNDCFILRGSAGTGKTTLIAHLLLLLRQQRVVFHVLAPTGRASRILGSKTGLPASTIHSQIYHFENYEIHEQASGDNDAGLCLHFSLKQADHAHALYIVDEASMVGDAESRQDSMRFGSGRLLKDLLTYARIARPGREKMAAGSKVLFIGDPAQLPPVGESLSPALSEQWLGEHYHLQCVSFELTDVQRQARGSAILEQATTIRNAIAEQKFNAFDISGQPPGIIGVTAAEGIRQVLSSYQRPAHQGRGQGSSVMVTYSNARALDHNRAVREQLWGNYQLPVQQGEQLLVNKNAPLHGLSNGDLVKVNRVLGATESRRIILRGVSEPVLLSFARVELVYRGFDGQKTYIECLMLENLLASRERSLTALEQRALLVDFRQRHRGLKPKTAEFQLALREDPWFNALQVKYGYAMTCHKAQGGEWDTVVVDFDGQQGGQKEAFFRWAYTALTRAKTQLMTIAAPRFSSYSRLDWGRSTELVDVPAESEQKDSVSENADADWQRFAFNPGQEPLYEHHLRLRDTWRQQGIEIISIEHLSYCQRYTLCRGDYTAVVQYSYNRLNRPTHVQGTLRLSHPGLLAEAENLLKQTLFHCAVEPGDEVPFIRVFCERVKKSIAGSGLELVSAESLSYRLRLGFSDGVQVKKIDFNYNSAEQWTRVEEVGGPGASGGVLDKVRSLLFDFSTERV
ncbi:ATP-dependent DNA helicase [Endozoicomonas acroporae]|uniref:ATP-dependent DNA helicase n=1 Tax=Endozoicomonas acroporae TaxID=1701104 RepID=UPI003D79D35F